MQMDEIWRVLVLLLVKAYSCNLIMQQQQYQQHVEDKIKVEVGLFV